MLKKTLGCLIGLTLLFIFGTEVRANVLINEFSSYDSNDWVELYATEDTDISNWILRDNASSVIVAVPAATTISAGGFYVIDANNRLNIDTDAVKIYKSDDLTKVDEIDYGGSGQVCAPGSGQSVGRFENGNTIERFAVQTKGATNTGASLAPCPTPAPSPTNSPTPAPTTAPTSAPTAAPTATPTKSPKPTLIPSATPDPFNNEKLMPPKARAEAKVIISLK